jgi:hypothetical protein
MILNDEEVQERIESPLNLLNRLKGSLSQTTKAINIPTVPPKAEDVIADLEDKIANTVIRSKAKDIMNVAMDQLKTRMPEVQKPEKLAQIAREMAHVVSSQEPKNNGGDSGSKIIVYAPQVLSLDNYNIVEVNE